MVNIMTTLDVIAEELESIRNIILQLKNIRENITVDLPVRRRRKLSRWTPEQLRIMNELLDRGASYEDIASRVEKTPKQISDRISYQNIK